MKSDTRAIIFKEGGKIVSDLVRLGMSRPQKSLPAPESESKAAQPTESMIITQEPATPPRVASKDKPQQVAGEIATACVPCALGHFSTSAGLLNETVRFKTEGITSNEILDRIAKVLEEQNALERVDLTPEKLQGTPEWERGIAEEALEQSRKLRHRLESITEIDELEHAAADTAGYYKKMNREWYKERFRHLGEKEAETVASRISSEDKERIRQRAEKIIDEV